MAAKTYLFVPGNRPERFEKAYASGADAVILDLEDAVATEAKVEARDAVCKWLSESGKAYVRVNAADTEWFKSDLADIVTCAGLLGIVVPKAEDADFLATVSGKLPPHAVLLPLIETAVGFESLRAIARSPKVERLLFGTIDFQVDTGIRGDGEELQYFRSEITLVSRLAGLAGPVDGVTATLDDGEQLRLETLRGRDLGFRGKLCIHPKQIAHVNAAFTPNADEIDWAKRVLKAVEKSKGSATTVDGKMVDVPIILKARDVLQSAGVPS
ncbi:HpcH/HpaI aldolase [Caballeronia fortuita]|uniref:HpcH/HpaI aldolase n=1 Tax=Caballeronia fortuita TaxID=1777138 RepID=A0A158CBB0_9BURK|nr:CoA ester lyase [Caballeronia fortuita]SAK79663.1 HpcH/HpaI aldolase [Caballeronia fortuita]